MIHSLARQISGSVSSKYDKRYYRPIKTQSIYLRTLSAIETAPLSQSHTHTYTPTPRIKSIGKGAQLTISASVIRLDMQRRHLSILDDQRVALTAGPAEDGRAVKVELERLGECARRVSEKSDL